MSNSSMLFLFSRTGTSKINAKSSINLDNYPMLGLSTSGPTFFYARWLFLRIIAIGFIATFLSLSSQVLGLIGSDGILPAVDVLDAVRRNQQGIFRFVAAPTVLWLACNDIVLVALIWLGVFAGTLLLLNILPKLSCLVIWICYLSFVSVAQNFSGFQSDGLMLEMILIGIFLAPSGYLPRLAMDQAPSRLIVFVMHWSLYKLMFESGLAKIQSGDLGWREFTAMNDYYVNCPFPTVLGWWVQHLPIVFHKGTVVLTLFVELILPHLIWLGSRLRRVTFIGWSFLQLGILLTANYTFLNYLSLALGLFLINDAVFNIWFKMPRRLFSWLNMKQIGSLASEDSIGNPAIKSSTRRSLLVTIASGVGVCVILTHLYITMFYFAAIIKLPVNQLPDIALKPIVYLKNFRSANRYGLFASMTHKRNEIEFEGSNDGGKSWRTYLYKWKPQELNVAPKWMAPHLPRMDWNLWFASLGSWKQYPFVIQIAVKLMEGKEPVAALFRNNPFPDKPPHMMRFPLYSYAFNDLKTWKKTRNYWQRQKIGYYAPKVLRHPKTKKFILIDS